MTETLHLFTLQRPIRCFSQTSCSHRLTSNWPVLCNTALGGSTVPDNEGRPGLAWPGPASRPGTGSRIRGVQAHRGGVVFPSLCQIEPTPHPPPALPLTSPKKRAQPQWPRMTARLTAAICFEVASQVLPLSLPERSAELLKCTIVQWCVRAIVHILEGVYIHTRPWGAEFAFSFWSLCIYYPFVDAKLFCISNVRKASTSPFQVDDQTPTGEMVSPTNPLVLNTGGIPSLAGPFLSVSCEVMKVVTLTWSNYKGQFPLPFVCRWTVVSRTVPLFPHCFQTRRSWWESSICQLWHYAEKAVSWCKSAINYATAK